MGGFGQSGRGSVSHTFSTSTKPAVVLIVPDVLDAETAVGCPSVLFEHPTDMDSVMARDTRVVVPGRDCVLFMDTR